jgi:hypothetical protein
MDVVGKSNCTPPQGGIGITKGQGIKKPPENSCQEVIRD